MPRNSPHRVTRKKLLKFTCQQSECKEIVRLLKRHEQILKRLDKAGYDWDPETGKITARANPTVIHPEDLKDE